MMHYCILSVHGSRVSVEVEVVSCEKVLQSILGTFAEMGSTFSIIDTSRCFNHGGGKVAKLSKDTRF